MRRESEAARVRDCVGPSSPKTRLESREAMWYMTHYLGRRGFCRIQGNPTSDSSMKGKTGWQIISLLPSLLPLPISPGALQMTPTYFQIVHPASSTCSDPTSPPCGIPCLEVEEQLGIVRAQCEGQPGMLASSGHHQ